MTLESIRRQVAIVTQEVMLFDDTIVANIAFGAGRPVTEEEIMQAAEAAYLKPLIDSLPEGLQTRIGEGGSKTFRRPKTACLHRTRTPERCSDSAS